MAHHKRKRPKNRRAGCLLCKPWKMNGFAKGRVDAESLSDHRRRFDAEGQLAEARVEIFTRAFGCELQLQYAAQAKTYSATCGSV
jgi:hypothetical protein